MDDFACTPAVGDWPGMAPPTAQAWLRKRAPYALMPSQLRRLFRARKVRLLAADGKVRVVKPGRELQPGDVLFAPREMMLRRGSGGSDDGDGDGDDAAGAEAEWGDGDGWEETGGSSSRGSGSSRGGGRRGAAADPRRDSPTRDASGRRRDDGGWPLVPASASAAPAAAPAPRPGLPVVTPRLVRSWVVAATRDWFVINKPAGVEVHGREPHCLAPALAEALGGGRWEEWLRRRAGGGGGSVGAEGAGSSSGGGDGRDGGVAQRARPRGAPTERAASFDDPRPVHRLDLRTSGALVVARSADAAAWLSLCFRGRTALAAAGLDEAAAADARQQPGAVATAAAPAPGRMRRRDRLRAEREREAARSALDGLSVGRVYFAVVQGALTPGASGRLRSRLAGGSGGGGGGGDGDSSDSSNAAAARAAVTHYSVVASRGGLSLLRLAPSTGRKHQLRAHCAELLRAPILNDYRYGYRDAGGDGASGGDAGGGDFRGGDGGSGGRLDPLYLHAHSIELRQPGAARPARVVAPLPRHMRALLAAQRWALPARDLRPATVPPPLAAAAAAAAAQRGSGGGGGGGAATPGGKRAWERWAALAGWSPEGAAA